MLNQISCGWLRYLMVVLAMMACGDVWGQTAEAESAGDVEASPIRSTYESPLFQGMNVPWRGFMEVLHRHGSKGSEYLIQDMNNIRKELGIANLFVHSDVLVRYAARAAREGKVKDARVLYRWATLLAPDNPAPYFGMATLPKVEGGEDGVASRLRMFFVGAGRTASHQVERLRLRARTASLWLWVGILVFLALQFVLLIRYLPLLARDLSDRLPEGVSGFHTLTALWILALAPVAFRVELVVVGLGWGLMTVLYLSVRERLCVAAAVVWVLTVPMANQIVNHSLERAGDSDQAIYHCAVSYCGKPHLKALEKEAARTEVGLAQEVLARHYLRRYLYDRTGKDILEMHLARALPVAGNPAVVHALEGNYLYARFGTECRQGTAGASGTRRQAIEVWERALEMDPQRYDVAHNLAMAYRLAGKEERASEYYALARRLGEESVTQFEQEQEGMRVLSVCPGEFNGNRYLMSPPIVWVNSQMTRAEEDEFTAAYGTLLLSNHQLGILGGLCLVFLFILVLMGVLIRFIRRAWFCNSCHQVSSGVNEAEFAILGICSSCISRRVKGTLWDPKANFFAARLQERAWNRKRSVFRALAYCIPGWGQVLFGRPVQGLLFLIVVSFAILPGVIWLPGETPGAGVSELSERGLFVSLGLTAVLYLWNWFSVYRLGRGRL